MILPPCFDFILLFSLPNYQNGTYSLAFLAHNHALVNLMPSINHPPFHFLLPFYHHYYQCDPFLGYNAVFSGYNAVFARQNQQCRFRDL